MTRIWKLFARPALRGLRWLAAPRLVAVLILLALLAVRSGADWVFAPLRNDAFDYYQRLHPRALKGDSTRPEVLLVDIDERSLAEFGQWPWPRSLLADLANNLMSYQSLVVGFDVLFSEEDRLSPAAFARITPELPADVAVALRAMPTNEAVFATALRAGRFVLAQTATFDAPGLNPPGTVSVAWRGPPGGIPSVLCPARFKKDDTTCDGESFSKDQLRQYPFLLTNLELLQSAAKGHGVVTVAPDPDGIYRRLPTLITVGGRVYPALALEMLRVGTQKNAYLAEYDVEGLKSVGITPQLRVPVDKHGESFLYYRPEITRISASEVLLATAPPGIIKGKLVIVGTSAAGLKDVRASPINPASAGFEIHANFLENIIDGAFLTRTSASDTIEKLAALLGGVIIIILTPMLGALVAIAVLVGLITTAAAYSWHQFVEQRVLVDFTYPAICYFSTYLLLTVTSYVKTSREKKRVRGAFAHYLSPALVDQLAKNPGKLRLGGETKNLTILFCDIRGFTSISETLKDNPQGLTSLINRFLTPMTDVILSHQGTIDKYIGDCIMAFWNAPLEDPDHPRHAVLSAVKMLREVELLNQKIEVEARVSGRKFIPIKIGIGVNSGDVVVGNMGSDQRFDYSVLGDAVNLASRLEGQSKFYGVGVVVGEMTALACCGTVALIELDVIAVKGKAEAVRIFTVCGDAHLLEDPQFKAFTISHDEMLSRYRSRDWRQTIAVARELRAANPYGLADLYELYEHRALDFQSNPPPPNWDGVFHAQSK